MSKAVRGFFPFLVFITTSPQCFGMVAGSVSAKIFTFGYATYFIFPNSPCVGDVGTVFPSCVDGWVAESGLELELAGAARVLFSVLDMRENDMAGRRVERYGCCTDQTSTTELFNIKDMSVSEASRKSVDLGPEHTRRSAGK